MVKLVKVYSILLIFPIREKQPQKASLMPLRPFFFYIYQPCRTLQEDDCCIQNDQSLSMQSFNWKRYKTCYTTYVSLMKVTFYHILPPINNYKNGNKQLKVKKSVREVALVLLGSQFSVASFFSICGEEVSGVDLQ